MNTFKTGMLMAGVTAMLVGMGYLIGRQFGGANGGTMGMYLMVVVGVLMNLGTFWFSDKIVLKMTRAQPVTREQVPWLWDMTERLSQRAGIPMPRLFIVPDPSPNAFATGRSPKHGVVAVNDGLLRMLSEREVEGVVAHEIAHIKHRDTLTSAVTAAIAGAISSLANIAIFASWFMPSDEEGQNPFVMLLATLVAPIAAMVIQFAVSRTREFAADRTAAELVGAPDGLQQALLKLERGAQAIPSVSQSPQTAHMAIVNPLSGGGMLSLFSTHPPIQRRVQELEKLRSQLRAA